MDISSPRKVNLEASAICQLKCPACPTAHGEIKKSIGTGHLKFSKFEQILAANPQLQEIELSNWGELFLNPEIKDIIQLAHEKKIALTACNGANLNTVKEEVLEALVKYQFKAITVSLDGATQETYAAYRVRGNIDAVLENIRKINSYKEKYNSSLPELGWQFILFKHNLHEVTKAKKIADDLGMGFYPKLSWDEGLSPDSLPEDIKALLGMEHGSRSSMLKNEQDVYLRSICHQIWKNPQIHYDGKVLGCCENRWEPFAHLDSSHNIQSAMNTDKLKRARSLLMGKEVSKEDLPCFSCHRYHQIRDTKTWITRKELGLRSPLTEILERHYHSSGLFNLRWKIQNLVSAFFRSLRSQTTKP